MTSLLSSLPGAVPAEAPPAPVRLPDGPEELVDGFILERKARLLVKLSFPSLA